MARLDRRRKGRRRSSKPGSASRTDTTRQRVRTARGRRASETRWLERQINDPWAAAARREGYRSRAAFKLIEIDDRAHLLGPGRIVLDLGASPGGWTQVALKQGGRVCAVDVTDMDPLAGATFVKIDFTSEGAAERIREALPGAPHVVLSDMAAPVTGHRQTDHLRTLALCEAAFEFAIGVLRPGGAFVAKVFQGGAEGELLKRMRWNFARVRHVKPKASRAESAETYVVATGFKPASD